MDRDYIDWLSSLPCNQRAPKINTWMGGWAPLPERLICLLTRIGRIARFSGITMALSLAFGVGPICVRWTYDDFL